MNVFTYLLVLGLAIGIVWVAQWPGPAAPVTTAQPQAAPAPLIAKGPEDDPAWGISGRRAWTALDELQLTRLLNDSAT